jgi:glycosyltransferase involved in cell wall biosynthesis
MTAAPSDGTGSAGPRSGVPASSTGGRASSSDDRRRRLLMIARDFPPASTSGSLRALTFARHLSEYGWDTSVVTIRANFHDSLDPALLRDVPPHCRVHPAFGFDTKARLAIRDRYLRLLATPDRAASWFPHAVLGCLRASRTEHANALLSTSPPVTAHCIGWAAKRLTTLPWILELRDAWNLDVPSGPLSRRVDLFLERHALRTADRIVVTTAELAAELERRLGRQVGEKVVVLPNGYDEAAFAQLSARPDPGAPFRIAHTGQCLPPERDPLPFLRAVRLCLDRGDIPADTEVLFVGAGAAFQQHLSVELGELRLASHVRSTPRLSHRQALQIILDTPLLLLLQDRRENQHAIPAKAYEYLRSSASILAVAPRGSATAALLVDFPGVMVAPVDTQRIAQCLAEAHRRWRDAGGRLQVVRRVDHYDRRHLTSALARLLDDLNAARAARPSPPS